MDAILESFVKDFAEHFGYESNVSSRLFELFVNRTVIARFTQDEFDIEKVSPGKSGDLGIDGFAILASGHPVLTREDINFFLERGNADIEFIFTQAKTSSSFNAAEIGSFLEGVLTFFGDNLPASANNQIRELWNLKSHIYASTVKLERAPSCRCYYATTGEWVGDTVCQERVNAGVERLNKTSLFRESPSFLPIDANKLKTMYRSLCHRVTCEIDFDKNTVIPSMEGVSEAYLGLLPCKEFLKLIVDDDGDLRPNLFYNNVRDFQGDTPVNKEIAEALCDQAVSKEFVLLNNGVTLVARAVNRIGNKFKLSDFQIVNGCQTSNVVFQNRGRIASSSYLPVKLIVTDDSEVTNRIIRATNRQTEVKPEAFESLAPFHRILEDFYNAMARSVTPRLYYERRSKQYIHQSMKQHQVITLAGQCVTFLAMFCDEPHSTHRYYGEILRSSRGRIFKETHQPFPYFLSALAGHRLELMFNQDGIERKFKTYKYHLLLLLRVLILGETLPPLNSKKINDECQKILDILMNRTLFEEYIEKALLRLKTCLNSYKHDDQSGNPPSRRRDFTNILLPGTTWSRPRGTVEYFNVERGFGFIRSEASESDIFVHATAIRESLQDYLDVGSHVEFDIVTTRKGKQAENVIILQES